MQRKSDINNSGFGQKIWLSVFDNTFVFICAVLGFLTLLIPVLSIEHAHWITPQPSLVITLVLAAAAGILLANRHLPNKLVIPLIIATGVLMMFWQTVRLFTSTQEISAVQSWWQTVSSSRPNEVTIYFAFFLVLSTWLFGSLSLWYIVRYRNPWICIISGAAMLLINLANLPRENYYFLFVYFVPAILLLGLTHLANQDSYALKIKDKFTRRGMAYLSIAVAGIAILTAGTAYLVPEPPINNLGLKLDTTSVNGKSVQDLWFNIFYSIESKWNIAKSEEHQKLLFKDPLDNDNNIYFVVDTASSDYWSTRRYDEYDSWGWTSTTETDSYLSAGEFINYPTTSSQGKVVTYTVENRSKTDVVLSKGDVIRADIPVKIIYFASAVNGASPSNNMEIAAITSTQLMRPYESYRIETTVFNATPQQLAVAGAQYPEWVTSQYLQLPATLPPRVTTLSHDLTTGANTPYEKVITIKSYLQQLTYDPNTPPIPEKVDGVDYFLFNSRRGVCTNFASAMTIMLRCSGVPARLVTGYLSGEPDKTTGSYIIRGRNTHAWVEVYFPGYGWIEIESTPSGPVPNNGVTVSGTDNSLSFSQGSQLPWWMLTTPPSVSNTGAAGNKTTHKALPWPYIYALLGIILLIFILYFVRSLFRRWVNNLINIETASQAYEHMCRLARRAKSGPLDSETPLEFSQRLAGYLPFQKEDIGTIAALYLNTRYSPRREIEAPERVKLQTAWVRLNRALIQYMLRLKKWFLVRYLLLRWLE